MVLLVALVVRGLYLLDSADDPAFATPIIDARVYDQAAREWVESGNLSPAFFWQPPLYPLILGTLYKFNGGSIVGVKIVQAVLGAVTCGLAALLGGRLFGRNAGVLAGLMTALYGPLLFYDAELLTHGWATFWAALLLVLLVSADQRHPGVRFGLVLGLVGGLAVLTRAEFLPFLIAAAAWLGWRWLHAPRTWSRRIAGCAAVAVGFALPTLPAALANQRVTGYFGILPAAGGINFYIGNHPDPEFVATAVGFTWNALRRQAAGAGFVRPYDESRYFYGKAWDVAKADPAGWMRRLGWKGVQLLSSREIPRSRNVYDVRPWSWMQTALTWKAGSIGFPFGVLLPLAAVGLVLHDRRPPVPVALFLALFSAAIVAVFVTGPYRLPLVPVLAVLAGAGLLTLADLVRRRQVRTTAAVLVGAVGAVWLTSAAGPFPLEDRDFEAGLWVGLGHAAAAAGDHHQAMLYYARELEQHPDSTPAHTQLGLLLMNAQRPDAALPHFEHALRVRPDLAETQSNYALALRAAGRLDEAEQAFRAAIALEPHWGKLHADLADLLRSQARFAEAVEAYRAALQLDPGSYKDHFNLGISLAELGCYEAAARAFATAAALRPHEADAHYLVAVAMEHAGRIDEAVAAYENVLRAWPHHREARDRLAKLSTPSPRSTTQSPLSGEE